MRGRSRHLDGTGLTSMLLHQSQRSLVKSVQAGTIVIASGTASNTATITGVSLANSMIFMLGREIDTTTGPNNHCAHLVLTNATTITATRQATGASGLTVGYVVVEFLPGVIKSVQRGTISLVAVTSNTATITAVNTAKSFVGNLGWTIETTDGAASRVYNLRAALTDATTVTASRSLGTGTAVVSYQVVEFY